MDLHSTTNCLCHGVHSDVSDHIQKKMGNIQCPSCSTQKTGEKHSEDDRILSRMGGSNTFVEGDLK